MIELIWFLGGIAVGVILALLLARSKRGDALLDRLLEWVTHLLGQDSPVRDEITERFYELLFGDGKADNSMISH